MTYHEFHELMMPSVSQRYTHELDGIVSAFRNNNNNNNPFNKLARRIVAENAPATKEIERIKNAFLAMDKDGSGTLTLEELSKGVRTAGYVVSDQDLKRLFKELDTDGTGLVRYHEFVAGAIDTNILVGDSLLRWVFEFMDDDDSNTITGANLKARRGSVRVQTAACRVLCMRVRNSRPDTRRACRRSSTTWTGRTRRRRRSGSRRAAARRAWRLATSPSTSSRRSSRARAA